MKRWIMLVVAVVASGQVAVAQQFPRHAAICTNGIVAKDKLAKSFLKSDDAWLNLYLASVDSADARNGRAQWQRIFTDKDFCKGNASCLAPDPEYKPKGNEKPPLNTKQAESTLQDLRLAFESAIDTNTRPGNSYRLSGPAAGPGYFVDSQTQLVCLANEPVAEPKPTNIKLPVRLRAYSDDLNIRSDDPAFKAVKPATLTYTREGTDQKASTVALQATVGYPVSFSPLLQKNYKGDLSSFDGEIIPYISADQSIRKVDGRPSTYSEGNNVAVGSMLSFDATFDSLPGIDHFMVVKPQYLWNTFDKSEIASVRLFYQPWTSRIPAINKPFPVPPEYSLLDHTRLTLLFDVRADIGQYIKVGDNPLTALDHTSFQRAGSRFGFALTGIVDKRSGSHVVLSVTETMLYGMSGSIRQLSFFEAVASYYFDSTSNFALTTRYVKGRDEDTAEQTQKFTAGLSAKF